MLKNVHISIMEKIYYMDKWPKINTSIFGVNFRVQELEKIFQKKLQNHLEKFRLIYIFELLKMREKLVEKFFKKISFFTWKFLVLYVLLFERKI